MVETGLRTWKAQTLCCQRQGMPSFRCKRTATPCICTNAAPQRHHVAQHGKDDSVHSMLALYRSRPLSTNTQCSRSPSTCTAGTACAACQCQQQVCGGQARQPRQAQRQLNVAPSTAPGTCAPGLQPRKTSDGTGAAPAPCAPGWPPCQDKPSTIRKLIMTKYTSVQSPHLVHQDGSHSGVHAARQRANNVVLRPNLRVLVAQCAFLFVHVCMLLL